LYAPGGATIAATDGIMKMMLVLRNVTSGTEAYDLFILP